MGVLRFILAIMVATYHFAPPFYGFHQGIIAVISFILISGYVMTLLIEKYYTRNIIHFYLDRLARLLPQFLFYSIAVLVLMRFSPLGQSKLSWMEYSSCSKLDIALNFSIFVNNFYLYFKNFLLIPQSWSLGLEAFFYLVIPIILIFFSNQMRLMLITLSMLVFISGYFGLIDFNLWCYRYLPGTLFIFLTGSSIAAPEKYPRYYLASTFGIAIVFLLFANKNMNYHDIAEGVLEGLVVGIPMLLAIRKLRPVSLDIFLGNLSYGIFLNHIIFLWLIEAYHIAITNYLIFAMLAASISLSFVTYNLIERPTIALRQKLRTIP